MENINEESALGVVRISDEVISVIAGIAAAEIEGVTDAPHGVSNNISHMLKGKKAANNKNIKVTLEENAAIIELNVSMEYGVKIPEVVTAVQENVKKTVEAMTGMVVSNINVNVHNIYMPKQEEVSKED